MKIVPLDFECKKCQYQYISIVEIGEDPGLCSECWHEEIEEEIKEIV